jgi:anthranilate/para-aminobenzoate synthase component I
LTVLVALHAPPDPLALAAALAGWPGLAALVSRPAGALRPGDARYSFVAAEPVEESDALVPGDCVPGGYSVGYAGGPAAPRWIGVVPYEALRAQERLEWTRRPDDRPPAPAVAGARPSWRRYAAVLRVDHATGHVCVEGDDHASAMRLARAVAGTRAALPSSPRRRFEVRLLPPDEPEHAHAERVRAALDLIAAGDLYQVNLARRIALELRGDVLGLFASLLDAAPAPWGFLQDLGETLVVGASPELALSVRGSALRTAPIKGTRPRGRDAQDDRAQAADLDGDPKERAELTMAVDVHRSDLGRVALPGSVRIARGPELLAGRTVWSRVAEVVAVRAPGTTLEDIARAVLPCGSVTGAPKVRAMEVIARLEPSRRGVYTGAFGYVGRDGSLELAMAIRTIEAGRAAGHGGAWAASYFTGGGIVADSDPGRELEETRWKAAQLAALLGAEPR